MGSEKRRKRRRSTIAPGQAQKWLHDHPGGWMEMRAAGYRGVRITFYENEEQKRANEPAMFGEGVNHVAALEAIFGRPSYQDEEVGGTEG